MKNIIVKKSKIVDTLNKNREAYKKLYDISLNNYRAKSIQLIEKEIEELDVEMKNEADRVDEFVNTSKEVIKELQRQIEKIQDLEKQSLEKKEEFNKGLKEYKNLKLNLLKKLKDDTVEISTIDLIDCPIEKPKDYSTDYNRVIELMKHLASEEIELEKDECDKYIMNQWDWKRGFIQSFNHDNHYSLKNKANKDYVDLSIRNNGILKSLSDLVSTQISNFNGLRSDNTFHMNSMVHGCFGNQGNQGPRGSIGIDSSNFLGSSNRIVYDADTEKIIEEF